MLTAPSLFLKPVDEIIEPLRDLVIISNGRSLAPPIRSRLKIAHAFATLRGNISSGNFSSMMASRADVPSARCLVASRTLRTSTVACKSRIAAWQLRRTGFSRLSFRRHIKRGQTTPTKKCLSQNHHTSSSRHLVATATSSPRLGPAQRAPHQPCKPAQSE